MSTAEVLRKALERLGPNGEHWTTGTSFRESGGEIVCDPGNRARAPKGTHSLCASAAIIDKEDLRLAHYTRSPAYKMFAKVIRDDDIPNWNDAPGRTFAEVKDAFEKAIQLAQREGLAMGEHRRG